MKQEKHEYADLSGYLREAQQEMFVATTMIEALSRVRFPEGTMRVKVTGELYPNAGIPVGDEFMSEDKKGVSFSVPPLALDAHAAITFFTFNEQELLKPIGTIEVHCAPDETEMLSINTLVDRVNQALYDAKLI